MNKTKETIIIGFAMFASLFGAGNLILPPFLGFNAGNDWWLVALGFLISAIIIPLLAILAHAKLQGTMLNFGKKVSPIFSLLFCVSIYLIAISLPIPRTASVVHEMAILPFFGTSSLLTSSLYFGLVFIFAMNRSTILNILGKYLTPFIIIILFVIIGVGVFYDPLIMHPSSYATPIVSGVLEGYQTYDALGGLLIGGVVVISLDLKGHSLDYKRKIIINGGLIAALGLFFIYGGLIVTGALYNTQFHSEIIRTELLAGLSSKILGPTSTLFLSILVALACFTTAVSVIVGAGDFFKGLFKNSKKAYMIAVIIACGLGIMVGQFSVHYIIAIALPALLFIYPIAIVLIVLNVLPEKYTSAIIFKSVVITTFLFSIPYFVEHFISTENFLSLQNLIPLSQYNLGWLLPAIIVFFVVNFFNKKIKST